MIIGSDGSVRCAVLPPPRNRTQLLAHWREIQTLAVQKSGIVGRLGASRAGARDYFREVCGMPTDQAEIYAMALANIVSR